MCPISILPWSGPDPYRNPSDIWQGTRPELRQAYEALRTTWLQKHPGSTITIISTWRPQEYQDHIRSIWDAWRFSQGQSVRVPTTYGGCPDAGSVLPPPAGWQACAMDSAWMQNLNTEANRHASKGDTRPSCTSDHIQGIAIDITMGTYAGVLFKEFVQTAETLPGNLALCHYIASDEPHFGLKAYLPPGTVCGRGI